MHRALTIFILISTAALFPHGVSAGFDQYFSTYDSYRWYHNYMKKRQLPVELGKRPIELVKDMDGGTLKHALKNCQSGPFERSDFSIGHRGAPMQYPEHTKESYIAAARMGAGIVECDVTFTKDQALVCRHSQCDLHTTSNILETPLAKNCSEAFQAAQFDADGKLLSPASAKCCTSDITLDEFKSLQGKMDTANSNATNVADYLNTQDNKRGTLMTHAESIALFKKMRVKMTPELKAPSVNMPFNGFSQQDYAQKLINEYKQAGIPASMVFVQSFNPQDIKFWLTEAPEFGKQAVFLDGRYELSDFNHRDPATWSPSMSELYKTGIRIIAPPVWMLVETENGKIVPSHYAKAARDAGLEIITWTLERSGLLKDGGGWYYQTLNGNKPNPANPQPGLIDNDGDMLQVLDVLAKDIGVRGVFSDWPATTTYYANCMNL